MILDPTTGRMEYKLVYVLHFMFFYFKCGAIFKIFFIFDFDILGCLVALGLGEMSQLSREPLYLMQIARLRCLLSTSSKINAFLNDFALLNS